MKDEIKEILDNKLYFDLEEEDYIKIKDYITNLQEELEEERIEQADLKTIQNLEEENEKLKKDLKTLWNVCWNNDTEMTSYQNEVFDNYYDIFHKNGGDEE